MEMRGGGVGRKGGWRRAQWVQVDGRCKGREGRVRGGDRHAKRRFDSLGVLVLIVQKYLDLFLVEGTFEKNQKMGISLPLIQLL